MGDDDGFMLNVNLSNASIRNSNGAQQPAKRQPRPRSWADKKNAKKNPQQDRGPRSGAGRSSFPSPPPFPSIHDNLLKGYALDLPSPSKPRARSPDTSRHAGFNEAPSPASHNKILSPLEDGGNTRNRDQPRKRSRNTLQASLPHHQNTKIAYEKPSKRIGRIRLASRMAGDREATPDQDDMRPLEEDELEKGDGEKIFFGGDKNGFEDIMAAVVAASVARDKLVEQELAVVNAERKKMGIPTADEYHSDDDNDDENGEVNEVERENGHTIAPRSGGGGYPGGGVYSSGANTMPLGEKGAADEDGNEINFVDFEYGGSAYPEFREKQKQKRARWESVGGPVPCVKPGMLTHNRGGGSEIHGVKGSPAAAAAAEEEVFFGGGSGDTIKNKNAAGLKSPSTFENLGLISALATHLETLGFTTPTAVQQSTIPVVLQDKDALVNAPTGSGKTLSYLAPIINDLATIEPRISRADGTLALIICPTRELCLQVLDTLTVLSRRFFWIVPGSVHGGENRAKEKARLRKGVSVLVTTPGRLLDHLQNTESFRIDTLKWLVLDEADRLLDLGFEKKISQILSVIEEKRKSSSSNAHNSVIHNTTSGVDTTAAKTTSNNTNKVRRRTILLSATLHGGLGGLAGLSLHQPEAIGWEMTTDKKTGKIVSIKDNGTTTNNNNNNTASSTENVSNGVNGYSIPSQLKQQFVQIPCKLRLVALAAMIRMKILTGGTTKAKVVVFFSNCDSVEFHHAVLSSGAWIAASGQALLPPSAPLLKLHGNMPQAERTSSLLNFTKAGAGVLLCTDVAARGLDFPAVTAIIQFDPPGTAEEYVHRVGRTARLGQSGEALLFIQPAERGYIDTYLKSQHVNLEEESTMTAFDRTLGMDPKAGKGLPIERHHGAYRLQKEVMDAVDSDLHLKFLAETAFRSSVRAYATHSLELKPFFNVKTLHIGHLAHSFALKASPAMVGKSSTGEEAKRRREEDFRNGGGGKKFKQQKHNNKQQQSPGGHTRNNNSNNNYNGKERMGGPGKKGLGGYVLS